MFLSTTALALAATSPLQERADRFLALANAGYKGLYKVSAEAQWAAVTDVKPEHDAAAATAGKAAAAFNGNPSLINEAKELLSRRSELNGITVRQLDKLLRNAAEGPMTNPELVAARVEAETRQASTLNGFEFKLDGQAISVNEIDNKLDTSTDLEERRRVWEASKESGSR
ncbi:MAG: M2 family metallopeptidase [Chthoniobacterales bacterium]|nr:M2 family metallopeptidase [Chthoniobacterales bacterium]